jgi:hypothetical protein
MITRIIIYKKLLEFTGQIHFFYLIQVDFEKI